MERMRRWLSPEGFVGTAFRQGELPDGKTAYRDVNRLALPAVAEMAFMSLMGAVDTMMVGNALGAEALAAVGLCHQPRLLLLCLFFALNTGVTAAVARRTGEDRREDADAVLRAALLLALPLAAALAVPAFLLAEPFLRLVGGERADNSRVLSEAAAYFRIMACALPAHALSMCLCAALRGWGKTAAALLVNAGGNGVNVLLNACLISGRWGFPRLEVKGAAIATAAGTGASLLLALLTVKAGGKRNAGPHLSLRGPWRIDRKCLRPLLRVSGSAALEQAGMRLGYLLCARALFSLGTVSFAAHQICMQLSALTFTVGDGLGVAGTALAGQALGKKRADLALLHGKICFLYAVVSALVFGLLIVCFRRSIAGWFIGAHTANARAVADCAAGALLSLALIQPFQTSAAALAGCLRGAGESRYAAAWSVLCVGVLRPILTLTAVKLPGFRLPGVWMLGSSELILRAALFYRRFAGGRWKDGSL